MAGFRFGDIKGKFSKSGGDDPNAAENEKLGAWDFDDEEGSDGFADAFDANDADDAYADNDAYSDDAEYSDDAGYADDADYDGAGYEDDQDYTDGTDYGDGEYDDNEYDDGYADDGDSARYDDDEYEDAEALGYNPDIFKNLDNDGDDYDYNAEDGEYADEPRSYDYYDDEEYDEREREEEPAEYEDAPEEKNGSTDDWLIFALLVLLPPVGVWLLWRGNKFDITLRSTLSAASIIWFIILLILIIPLFSPDDDNTVVGNDNPFINPSAQLQSAWPATSPSTAPSSNPFESPTAPSNTGSTVNAGNTGNTGSIIPAASNNPTGTTGEPTYVYMANAGIEYHLIEDCGGLTGANKVTLDFAKQRGLNPCVNCAGGTNPVGTSTGTQAKVYYATTNGTWYHLDSTCQDMKGAVVVTEANAIASKKTACPKCIGYYGTLGGKAYHSVSNCQSMQNAITKTKEEWEKLGKPACSICIKGGTSANAENKTPTQTMVYATGDGTYFHTKPDCTGMKNANYGSLTLAVNSYNKKPCPKCVSPDTIYVFATPTGEYFHLKNNCTGMKNAIYNKMSAAIALNKPACPKCASMFASVTASSSGNSLGGTPVKGETTTYVYATKNGANFHTDPKCKGMANAQKVTFAQAVSSGKPPCTKCVTPDKLLVFATADGKYYHTKSDCTGMKNAIQVKASVAIANNKPACPTCAKVISGVKGTSTGTSTGGTGTGGSTATNPQSASASSTVYIKTGSGASDYYHVGARCSAQGLSGMQNVTLEYAKDHSYKPCPACKPPSRIST